VREGDLVIELINYIVAVLCSFILGVASHSVFLHEKERHGWSFPWDHDDE